MNDSRVSVSKYAWVAMAAAFLLIFGSVWFASSLGGGVRDEASASKPDVVAGVGREPVYPAGLPVEPNRTLARAGKPERPHGKITPRDMFPVGDVTRDLPVFSHPYRIIAELFPSFQYEGKVWSNTGRYVCGWQADLTPTGYSLAGGQKLYALANTAAPDAVLFVQSGVDPDRFAIYRAI
jgi:hypothetical protein